jgi:hypothetical protein
MATEADYVRLERLLNLDKTETWTSDTLFRRKIYQADKGSYSPWRCRTL